MRSGSFVVRIELVVPAESTLAASSQRIVNVPLYSLDGSGCGTLGKSAPLVAAHRNINSNQDLADAPNPRFSFPGAGAWGNWT
jgi:hypothetical protein